MPSVALLLAELTRLGIQLQVHGDRLRYRPRDALTAELAERVKAHKPNLMAILRVTGPRVEAARMIRQARQTSNRDLAVALRDAWRERVAICEIDGGLSQEVAEAVAKKELKNILHLW